MAWAKVFMKCKLLGLASTKCNKSLAIFIAIHLIYIFSFGLLLLNDWFESEPTTSMLDCSFKQVHCEESHALEIVSVAGTDVSTLSPCLRWSNTEYSEPTPMISCSNSELHFFKKTLRQLTFYKKFFNSGCVSFFLASIIQANFFKTSIHFIFEAFAPSSVINTMCCNKHLCYPILKI